MTETPVLQFLVCISFVLSLSVNLWAQGLSSIVFALLAQKTLTDRAATREQLCGAPSEAKLFAYVPQKENQA